MISAKCSKCSGEYGKQSSQKRACVVHCGHSYCYQCIHTESFNYQSFMCQKCNLEIPLETVTKLPTNRLYYQMMEQVDNYIREKQYESPQRNSVRDEGIKVEEKCQYDFCFEKRYGTENNLELFCSLKCKKLYDEICKTQQVL